MKAKVESNKCIGCGNCVAVTESLIFDFSDEGLAEAIVDEVPVDKEEITKDAKTQCPTDAIIIE